MKVGGIEYRERCAVVVAVEDDCPAFVRIDAIYVVDSNRVLLQGLVFSTTHYYQHCHVYVIRKTRTHKLINVDDLDHPYPYCIRHLYIDNSVHIVIVPKYHIIGTLPPPPFPFHF